jgi:hypothetical protein
MSRRRLRRPPACWPGGSGGSVPLAHAPQSPTHQNATGVHPTARHQKLIWKGKTLEDGTPLKDVPQLKDGSRLMLIVSEVASQVGGLWGRAGRHAAASTATAVAATAGGQCCGRSAIASSCRVSPMPADSPPPGAGSSQAGRQAAARPQACGHALHQPQRTAPHSRASAGGQEGGVGEDGDHQPEGPGPDRPAR